MTPTAALRCINLQRDRVGKDHWASMNAYRPGMLCRFVDWWEEHKRSYVVAHLPLELLPAIPETLRDQVRKRSDDPQLKVDGTLRIECCPNCQLGHLDYELLPEQDNAVRCIACSRGAEQGDTEKSAKLVGWAVAGGRPSCAQLKAHLTNEIHMYRHSVMSQDDVELSGDRLLYLKMRAACYLAQIGKSARVFGDHVQYLMKQMTAFTGHETVEEMLGHKEGTMTAGKSRHTCTMLQACLAAQQAQKTKNWLKQAKMIKYVVDEMHRGKIKWFPDIHMVHVVDEVGQDRVMVLAVQPVLQQDESELPKWVALHKHMEKVAAGREDESSDEDDQTPRQRRGRPREVPTKQMPFGAQAVLVRMMRSLGSYTDSDEDTLRLLSKVVQINVDGCSTMSGKFAGFGERVRKFVPDVVVTVDFFHNIETAWRHVRKEVPELRQFLDDLNYVSWIWKRNKLVVTRVRDWGGTRSVSQGCATRQIKPTLVVLEQVGLLYGHLHRAFTDDLAELQGKEKRANDRLKAKHQKEQEASRRREARSAGDQPVVSELPRVPRQGEKRDHASTAGGSTEAPKAKKQKATGSASVAQAPAPVRQRDANKRPMAQAQAPTAAPPAPESPLVPVSGSSDDPVAPAIVTAEPENDPEPEGYRSDAHKKSFFTRFLSRGFCVSLFGLTDVLSVILPLSAEAQSERGVSDGTAAKQNALADLGRLLLGATLQDIAKSGLSAHRTLKGHANHLRFSPDKKECTVKYVLNAGPDPVTYKAVLNATTKCTDSMVTLRQVVNKMIGELKVNVKDDPIMEAVDRLGVRWWIHDEASCELAVEACATLGDQYGRYHCGEMGRCFQQLVELTQAQEKQVLAALRCKWEDNGASKKFWQYVYCGTGVFAELVTARPNLLDLARMCLLLSRSSVTVDRVGSQLNQIITVQANRWHPVPLLRRLVLIREVPSYLILPVEDAVKFYRSLKLRQPRKCLRSAGSGSKKGRRRVVVYDPNVLCDDDALVFLLREELEDGNEVEVDPQQEQPEVVEQEE